MVFHVFILKYFFRGVKKIAYKIQCYKTGDLPREILNFQRDQTVEVWLLFLKKTDEPAVYYFCALNA